MKRIAWILLAAYIALACALFLPQLWWPDAALYTRVVPSRWLSVGGFVGMFAPLTVGAVFAVGVAQRLEPENRARPAWRLLSGWLACFSVGEGILGVYTHVLRVEPPIPSVGDGFFLAGYVLLAAGAIRFVRVYTTSGMSLGPPRELLILGVIAALVLGGVGWVLLGPLLRAPRPLPEVLVTAGYPVLDFAVMIPMALLVRITLRFRGGRVWTVWASILAGFTLLAAADTLFARLDLLGAAWLDPLLDPLFMAGYALTAYGAALQFDVVGPSGVRHGAALH
jgi:hypothetical protein